MKAAVYTGKGAVQVQDVEKPVPADNEVLVRIHATTICAADYRVKSFPPVVGWLIGLRKGKILGMELSGTVESVGPAVTRFRPGDQVFGDWIQARHARGIRMHARKPAGDEAGQYDA